MCDPDVNRVRFRRREHAVEALDRAKLSHKAALAREDSAVPSVGGQVPAEVACSPATSFSSFLLHHLTGAMLRAAGATNQHEPRSP